jgi:hypothetical protein
MLNNQRLRPRGYWDRNFVFFSNIVTLHQYFWDDKIKAGPSSHAVWGVGVNRLDTEVVGSNPA